MCSAKTNIEHPQRFILKKCHEKFLAGDLQQKWSSLHHCPDCHILWIWPLRPWHYSTLNLWLRHLFHTFTWWNANLFHCCMNINFTCAHEIANLWCFVIPVSKVRMVLWKLRFSYFLNSCTCEEIIESTFGFLFLLQVLFLVSTQLVLFFLLILRFLFLHWMHWVFKVDRLSLVGDWSSHVLE